MVDPLFDREFELSLPGRFEAVVAEEPGHLAFKQGELELTFEALNIRANQVAHRVHNDVGGEPQPVLTLIEDPARHAVAQLGILKVGHLCVPIDANFPERRRRQIAADAAARLVVSETRHADEARALADNVVFVDTIDDGAPADDPDVAVDPRAGAYVLYTSGSTGKPKGVVQSHAAFARVGSFYGRDFEIGPGDRLTTPTSLAYTGTLWGLFGALLNGAAFVRTELESPRQFAAALADHGITHLQLMVTLLRQLVTALEEPLDLPGLRLVYTGGEVLQSRDVERFARIFPSSSRLIHNFGATESGIVTHHHVDLEAVRRGDSPQRSEDAAFPSGHPVEGVELVFLRGDDWTESDRDEGEIAVQSRFLANGYLGDPERTAARFSTPEDGSSRIYRTGDIGRLRPDGSLVVSGRRDHQVKVRGYRIDLEEVEGTLRAIEGVRAAAIRAVDTNLGKTQLIAYLARGGDDALTIPDVRRRMEETLPGYMVPAAFVEMERLPTTSGGKVDRRALPDFDGLRPELETPFVEARTPTETVLVELWSEVLGVQPVGVRDNFFELGGDSLSLFQMRDRIHRKFGLTLRARAFFAAPTIESLAELIDTRG